MLKVGDQNKYSIKLIKILKVRCLSINNLQVISNTSARHVSVISGKSEIHPIISVVKHFQKCNPPNSKFHPGKLTNKTYTWWNINFEYVFTAINNTKKKTKKTYSKLT